MMQNFKKISLWLCQMVAATIMFYAALEKFLGFPLSLMVFKALGLGDGGRVLVGSLECIAGLLLMDRRFSAAGAGLSTMIMTGAIIAHVTVLGASGPYLYMIVLLGLELLASGVIVYFRRRELPFVGSSL